jgi:transcriptional regulator with XRE-family HTH domain/tetratricopeptide (TPR) repeat protein
LSEAADPGGTVGSQLRRRRLLAGLTQEELAGKSGLSVRTISDIERGRIERPRRDTLRRIAAAFGAPARPGRAPGAAAHWRPVSQMPADLADFTGRRAEVERLTGLLAAAADGEALGAVVVSAVAGAGGIGKSALAVHAAHQIASRFPDGQMYLNLRGSGSHPVAPGDALARFLRDLGTDPAAMPADEGERAARYRSLMAGRRLLIMLDDARNAAQVRPLLPGTAGCAVVITSRSSLTDLESARLLDLGILARADARALFARIVGSARAEAEPAAVQDVLAACGGLPLAIRIAAARLAARPGWRIATLAVRLGDARRRLDELQAGDLAVRASFTVSLASVRQAAGPAGAAPDRVFRMLAVADGPDISLPAAAALLGVPLEPAEQSLELLVDSHLLQSAAPGRYRFHDLLRVYAGERALAEESAAQRGDAVHRMLRWYARAAAAAAYLLYPQASRVCLGPADPGTVSLTFTDYGQALAWLDAEYANLVSAVGQAARQGRHELAWKLPASLTAVFYLRGQISDWISTHKLGLASARTLGDRNAEWRILNNLSLAYIHAKCLEAAIDCQRRCLPIVRDAGDLRAIATTLVNLGGTLAEIGRYEEAMRPLQESLRLFLKIGNRAGEGIALGGIGKVHRRRGEFSPAIAHYRRSLDAARETGDFVTEGATLLELSRAHLELGHGDQAIHEATAAVELYRQTGNNYGEAQAMAVLGRAAREAGHPAQARRHWLGAAALFAKLGLPQADEIAGDLQALET